MSAPSEPLLAWLQELLDKRGMSVSVLAGKTGLDRKRVKKILAGTEPMMVDELLTITNLLEVSPTDLGLTPADAAPRPAPAAPAPALPAGVVGFENTTPDQAAMLVESGFLLGCTFMMLVDTAELAADSGLPEATVAQYSGKPLPIKFEHEYHKYNEPDFFPDSVAVTLSFDALYRCTFPWTSIRRMLFWPKPIEAPPQPEEEATAKKPGAPFLKLVE